jgi:hypothetical protein
MYKLNLCTNKQPSYSGRKALTEKKDFGVLQCLDLLRVGGYIDSDEWLWIFHRLQYYAPTNNV